MNWSRLLFCSVVGLWAVIVESALAEQPYREDNRRQYIASVLTAFAETDLTEVLNTHRYLDVARRNHCRSGALALRADCLLSYARKNCETAGATTAVRRCGFYSDVMVVNKLNERVFVGRSERFGIMKGKRGKYRDVLASRIQQKYARIVIEFSLTGGAGCASEDFRCLARKLDRFCLDYANTESLSWHHCVSASLWMIGTVKLRE